MYIIQKITIEAFDSSNRDGLSRRQVSVMIVRCLYLSKFVTEVGVGRSSVTLRRRTHITQIYPSGGSAVSGPHTHTHPTVSAKRLA